MKRSIAIGVVLFGIGYLLGMNREDDPRMKIAWAFRDQPLERLLFGPEKQGV